MHACPSPGTIDLQVEGVPAACGSSSNAVDQAACRVRYQASSTIPADPATNVSAPADPVVGTAGVVTLQGNKKGASDA